ncbi:hypothetical protein BDQ17DRAFT_1261283 [Cyathus striatus]|nr:hypothetical protein BDQ17DRAFT_1261283 [Cyathus striatus]
MRHPDFYRRQAETQAKIILHIMASQLVHCHNLNPYNIWTTLSNIHSFHGCFTIISLCCHFYCIASNTPRPCLPIFLVSAISVFYSKKLESKLMMMNISSPSLQDFPIHTTLSDLT